MCTNCTRIKRPEKVFYLNYFIESKDHTKQNWKSYEYRARARSTGLRTPSASAWASARALRSESPAATSVRRTLRCASRPSRALYAAPPLPPAAPSRSTLRASPAAGAPPARGPADSPILVNNIYCNIIYDWTSNQLHSANIAFISSFCLFIELELQSLDSALSLFEQLLSLRVGCNEHVLLLLHFRQLLTLLFYNMKTLKSYIQ